MNQYKVLTVRDIEFTDDSNKTVKGMQLWVCGETTDEGWNGWEVVKIWVPDGSKLEDIVAMLKHDDTVMIEFNRRGKAVKVELV